MSRKVLLAGTESEITRIVYHYLSRQFPGMEVILEQRLPRRKLLRYRIGKLGLLPAVSQLMFVFLIRPFLRLTARARVAQVCSEAGLTLSPIPDTAITHVPSINSPEALETLARLDPKLVVVSGTRIISRKILEAGERTFLNIHTGMTPAYRGSHGGYWALYNEDAGNFGVTVHVVDAGIDTGGIAAQAVVKPSPGDNFVSYPYLQTAAALAGLVTSIERALEGKLLTRPAEGASRVWYHPGFFQYLGGRLRGVK